MFITVRQPQGTLASYRDGDGTVIKGAVQHDAGDAPL